MPRHPLLCLISLAMAARVKDMVVVAAAITRTGEVMVVAAATTATTLPTREPRAREVSPALPRRHGPPSTTLGPGPLACTLIRLQGAAATPPSAAAGSHHYAWTDHGRRHYNWTEHGRPSIHTTLGANPGSTADVHHPAVAVGRFSILYALAWLMGLVVISQLFQYNDAPNATHTYGVGHRLQSIESHHS
jgi:hypothetical protein